MKIIRFITPLVILVLVLFLTSGCSVNPKPGATFSGTISMDRAQNAQITLKVSDDGKTIEQVSVMFTDLKCEGYSSGRSSTTVSTSAPIAGGKFDFKLYDTGEISGQFKSPNEVQGTIHLAFFESKIECGTWDWSATSN